MAITLLLPPELDAKVSLRGLSLVERLGEPFRALAVVATERSALPLRQLVGAEVTIEIEPDPQLGLTGSPCTLGAVCSVAALSSVEPHGVSLYELTLVAPLALLGMTNRFRVFQHRSAPAIVGEVFAKTDVAREWELAWEIDPSLQPLLPYRVQYGESDLAFVQRVCASTGIALVCVRDGRSLRLSDGLGTSGQPVALRFVDRGMNRPADVRWASEVSHATALGPSSVVVGDQDLLAPLQPVEAKAPLQPVEVKTEVKAEKAEVKPAPAVTLARHEHAPGAALVTEKTVDDPMPVADQHGAVRRSSTLADAIAALVLDAEHAEAETLTLISNCIDLVPGTRITLDNHPSAELDDQTVFLVSECRLQAGADGAWSVRVRLTRADRPYRPRRHDAPRAGGLEVGIVAGPENQAIHCDELGRVQVRFAWSRGQAEEPASCWLPVAQAWAGPGSGALAVPHVGQAVVVGFLDGDVDRPCILGALAHKLATPPYPLPEARTRTTWRTRSIPGGQAFNELSFEDQQGRETLYLHAGKDLRREVAGDEASLVQGRKQERIGGRADRVVVGEARERLGALHLTVDGDVATRVGGKASTRIDGDRHQRVAGLHALQAKTMHLEATGSLVIEASDVTLRVGGNFVRLGAEGVTIVGKMVDINSGGSPGEGSGAAPADAEAAEPPADTRCDGGFWSRRR
jgi:type VI secretion system secreted protein VgrG